MPPQRLVTSRRPVHRVLHVLNDATETIVTRFDTRGMNEPASKVHHADGCSQLIMQQAKTTLPLRNLLTRCNSLAAPLSTRGFF